MPAPNSCAPCDCEPGTMYTDYYRQSVISLLCELVGDTTDSNDWEMLCDPGTGQVVLFKFDYDADGVVTGSTVLLPDGSAYAGVVANLVACDTSAVIAGTQGIAAFATLAFGSIPVLYAVALVNVATLRYLKIHNRTDADVDVSLDGAATLDVLIPGERLTIDLAALGLFHAVSVHAKQSGAAPTTGILQISGLS